MVIHHKGLVLGGLLLACGACGQPPVEEKISLSQDVVPLLQGSCGFGSGCHGTARPAGYVQLTLADGEDAHALWTRLQGKSVREPSLALVSPGDPAGSFLLHKVTGDFTGLPCAASSCGERMPQRSEPLPDADLAMLRQWIEQGALVDE